MARVYADEAAYEGYTGTEAPADIVRRLTRASQLLDARVLRYCWYEVDEEGMPTDELVLAAVRDATCAQAQWWDETGDELGTAGRWSSVKIGTLALGGGSSGGDATGGGREVAPTVWDHLRSPDLTADRFRLGAVSAL